MKDTLLRSRSILTLSTLLIVSVLLAPDQAMGESIDDVLTIDGVTRGYSLYIPESYSPDRSYPAFLAFHPFNTQRWNAISWRDTLTAFAETNGLILVCPDGGADGNVINEEVDTLLATALLDSALSWYTIDADRVYVIGFSMGGAATYRYGIANVGRFGGFLPIGAAVNGTDGFTELLDRVAGLPFAVIHGSNDALAFRYTPVVEALEANSAVLWTRVLPGVGHTVDFPQRNALLTEAYLWLDSVNSASISHVPEDGVGVQRLHISPNPVLRGGVIDVEILGEGEIRRTGLYDVAGRYVSDGLVSADVANGTHQIGLPHDLVPGWYMLRVTTENGTRVLPLQVR